jgi:hypothetical protein
MKKEDIEKESMGSNKIAITTIDDLVIVKFEHATKWMAFPKDFAIQLGETIIAQANSIKPH